MRDWFSFRTAAQGSMIFVCLMAASLYIAYQARFLIVGPQIILHDEIPMLQNTRQITLTGSASNISRLWLNGRPIFTDREGQFTAAVILENGYTMTTLTAEDRYGRTTTITRPFVYAPMNFTQS